jgi:hypothetical protein
VNVDGCVELRGRFLGRLIMERIGICPRGSREQSFPLRLVEGSALCPRRFFHGRRGGEDGLRFIRRILDWEAELSDVGN